MSNPSWNIFHFSCNKNWDAIRQSRPIESIQDCISYVWLDNAFKSLEFNSNLLLSFHFISFIDCFWIFYSIKLWWIWIVLCLYIGSLIYSRNRWDRKHLLVDNTINMFIHTVDVSNERRKQKRGVTYFKMIQTISIIRFKLIFNGMTKAIILRPFDLYH